MKRARHGGQIATARALRREAMKPSGAFPISTAIQEAFAKAVKVTKVKSIAPAERILTEKRDTLSVELEQVTPEKAFAWLNHANDGNRSIRDTKVNTYTDDMMNGKWTNCETPISFYKDGFLANGQHRLTAIVASKTTQLFPIYRGLNREDGLNIDTGLTRTVVDNGRISGLDTHLSNALVATARAFHTGAVVLFAAAGIGLDVSFLYWLGVVATAALLAYEHSLVRPGDLRRLDAAFFTMNGVISVAFFVFVLADVL